LEVIDARPGCSRPGTAPTHLAGTGVRCKVTFGIVPLAFVEDAP